MSRVFVFEATGAVIYVFADDHCPPHVHARHRGEGWVARVGFSYIDSAVELISIAPLKNAPLQREVTRFWTTSRPARWIADEAGGRRGRQLAWQTNGPSSQRPKRSSCIRNVRRTRSRSRMPATTLRPTGFM